MDIIEIKSDEYKISANPSFVGKSYFKLFSLIEYDFNNRAPFDGYKEVDGEITIQIADGMYVIDLIELNSDGSEHIHDKEVILVLDKYEKCKEAILLNILCGEKKLLPKDCHLYDGVRNEWHVKLSQIKLIYNELLNYVNMYIGNSDVIEDSESYLRYMVDHTYKQLNILIKDCGVCERCNKEYKKIIKL